MRFLTLADWTGMVVTELFAKTYKSYGLATVRYPCLKSLRRSSRSTTDGNFFARLAGQETEKKPFKQAGLAPRDMARLRGSQPLWHDAS
jgi:hypothetical protein